MRWLIAADLHLRPETWARLPQLRGDAYESLRQIVDIAIREKVVGILLLGDVFDSSYPDALSVLELAKAADKCIDAGVPFLLIQGNHDAVTVRGDDQAPISWANAVDASWAHTRQITLGPVHTGYALDYTPPGQLAAALAAVPANCDVLFAHQSWAELQRIGHTDGNAAMLPPHIRFVISGDNHKRQTLIAQGPGGLVMFHSPGSTCMCAMNESPDKYVDIIDFSEVDPKITSIQLVTRQFVPLVFPGPTEFDLFVSGSQHAFDGRERPPAIMVPLVHAKVSDAVPNYKARLRDAFRCDCHIDCVPLPAELTGVEINYEEVAVQGGFETLTSAVQVLAERDGSPPGVAEDVIALLRSNDRTAALGEIHKQFLARRAAISLPEGKDGESNKSARPHPVGQ